MAVLRELKPHRIGHGVRAAYNPEATQMLADSGVVLELCPTSNLRTRAVRDLEDFGFVLTTFQEAGIPYTVNTDGTYLCGTNMQQEFQILLDSDILTPDDAETARQRAFECSFLEGVA